MTGYEEGLIQARNQAGWDWMSYEITLEVAKKGLIDFFLQKLRFNIQIGFIFKTI